MEHNETPSTLRDIRIAAGLSQEELGRMLVREETGQEPAEACQSRISAYETGRNQLSLRTALTLVDLLNKVLTEKGSSTVARVDNLLN